MTNYSCWLLRPHAPPFQKIKRNPLNQVTFMQKSCFLGPTIFEIPQPNGYWRQAYVVDIRLFCNFGDTLATYNVGPTYICLIYNV